MDEAAAKLRMERDSVPEELDEISRRLAQLEIEREAIRRESKQDPKLAGIEKEIAEGRRKRCVSSGRTRSIKPTRFKP